MPSYMSISLASASFPCWQWTSKYFGLLFNVLIMINHLKCLTPSYWCLCYEECLCLSKTNTVVFLDWCSSIFCCLLLLNPGVCNREFPTALLHNLKLYILHWIRKWYDMFSRIISSTEMYFIYDYASHFVGCEILFTWFWWI